MLRTGGDWTKWNLSATTSTTATSWIYINTLWESTVAMEHPVKILYKWRFTVSLNEKITHQIWNHTWNCWSLSTTVRMSSDLRLKFFLKDLTSPLGNQWQPILLSQRALLMQTMDHMGHYSELQNIPSAWKLAIAWEWKRSPQPSWSCSTTWPSPRHPWLDCLRITASILLLGLGMVGAFCWWCKHV